MFKYKKFLRQNTKIYEIIDVKYLKKINQIFQNPKKNTFYNF